MHFIQILLLCKNNFQMLLLVVNEDNFGFYVNKPQIYMHIVADVNDGVVAL